MAALKNISKEDAVTVASPPKVGPLGYWVGCFKKYAAFSGRARRAEYWWFTLFNLLAYALVLGVAHLVSNGTDSRAAIFGVFIAVYLLAVLLPSLAVTVRRLHDANLSGAWFLISLVPGLSIVVFIMTLLPGTAGPNKYGPDPRQVA